MLQYSTSAKTLVKMQGGGTERETSARNVQNKEVHDRQKQGRGGKKTDRKWRK